MKAAQPDFVFFTGYYGEGGLLLKQKKDMNWNVPFMGAAFAKKYGNPPSSVYAVLAGDGFRVIAYAIDQTKSTDTSKLADYLHKDLKDFPGLTGKISFNDKGDRVGEVYKVYKVNPEGQFILQP